MLHLKSFLFQRQHRFSKRPKILAVFPERWHSATPLCWARLVLLRTFHCVESLLLYWTKIKVWAGTSLSPTHTVTLSLREGSERNKAKMSHCCEKLSNNLTSIWSSEVTAGSSIMSYPYSLKLLKDLKSSHGETQNLFYFLNLRQSMATSSMNHREGSWPSYVKTENKEAKNKFLSRVCKEDMFKFTTIKLAETVSKVLKENNTVNLEQIYFTEGEQSLQLPDDVDSKDRVSVICKLKDFSKRRRPVSCLSWQKSPSSKLSEVVAVSHCSSEFQGCYSEASRDVTAAYISDISVSSCYKTKLEGPGHITALEFNERNVNLLSAGCYDGQVCFFDQRTPPQPAGLIDFYNSHRDAVYGIKWVGKTGSEFLTGSQDGLVKWWDIRKFERPTRQFIVSCDEGEDDVSKADAISCLSFEQTIPSKFLMGTNQGNVISCRMTPKVGNTSLLLSAWRQVRKL